MTRGVDRPIRSLLVITLFLLGLPMTALAQNAEPPESEEAPAATEEEGAEEEGEDEEEEEEEEEVESNDTALLVLPFQAIYRSVPQPRLDRATELLTEELDNRDGLTVVAGAKSEATAGGPTLDGARELVQEARRFEAERKIADAIATWKKAVAAFEKNASAIASADEYLLAHHYLARAQMFRGDDKAARATLNQVARMSPNISLPEVEFSRLYRKWFEKEAKEALKEKRGNIMVSSLLPGAAVTLDGREMDVAPVMLEKVTPGKHLVRAVIDDVPPFGVIVQVSAKKEAKITAEFSGTLGGSAVGKVTDSIAQNTLPASAVKSAAEAGRQAEAPYVIFGAMAKAEDRYRVHTFVVDVAKLKVVPLEVVNFDLDMLTAESDVLRIVTAAHSQVEKFDGALGQIAKLETRLRPQNIVNRVNAAPKFTRRAEKRVVKKKTEKKRRQVFQQLGGGTIEIKDEEE